MTNLKDDKTPQQVYQHYKSRADIEILFDTFKNILFADTTYMRSNEAMEGWLFINHLAFFFAKNFFPLVLAWCVKNASPSFNWQFRRKCVAIFLIFFQTI